MSSNPAISIGITATDQARHVLQQVDQKIAGTTSVVEQNAAKMVSHSQQMSTQFKQNFGSIVTAAAGLGAGIVSMATSFSSIDKAVNASNQANITYQTSLQQLNKLQEGGKATNEQLALAQEKVRVNADKLKTAQGDVNDRYATFFANVPSQLISFGVAGASIMKMLGVSHAAAGASATGQAGATNLLNASLLRTVGAAIAARAAMIAAFIATPVGAVITAASIVIGLFAFNVGGLRDRIFELGNAIMAFLRNHFRPLHDAILWFINNVAKPLGNFFGEIMPSSVDTATTSIDMLKASTVDLGNAAPTAIMQVQSAFVDLESAGVSSANNINAAYDRMKQGLSDSIEITVKRANTQSLFSRPLDDRVVHLGGPVDMFANMTNFANPAGGRQLTARIMANGGTLSENVFGFGTRTGTPHLLHEGETVTPRAGGKVELHVHVNAGSKEIAHAIFDDINTMITRKRTTHMRITHEAIHGTM